MINNTQQKYYDLHYSISEKNIWQEWKPKSSLVEKNLAEFIENFWTVDVQASVFATLAQFAPFKSVLDIGCSAGDFLIPLSKSSNSSYGVDIVDFSTPWDLLRREYGINCQRLNLDHADLPFEDASFDLVTMLMVLEHVFDVHHAIQEIARVLETNGIAVIQVPNIAYIMHRLDLLLGRLPCTSDIEKRNNKTEWDGQHLHYFTIETLNNLLNQYGLQIQRVKCSGKFGKLRWFLPSLLGADLIIFAKKF